MNIRAITIQLKWFISDKDEQKKTDLSKCPAHLFVVSKTKQKIEVKPAKTEDVIKLQKWWTLFKKSVIIA